MNILCLYGSATGNSDSIAKRLHTEAIQKGYKSTVSEMNAFATDKISNFDVILIVCATTGNGDPPENAESFWRWLKKPNLLFKGKLYSVLGLGDTNYENFCKMGVQIDKRMLEIGAIPIQKRGTADDAVGLESVVEPWISNLWKALEVLAKSFVGSKNTTDIVDPSPVVLNFEKNEYFPMKIKSAEYLTESDALKQVLHVEVECKGISYKCGQIVGLLPSIDQSMLDFLKEKYTSEEIEVFRQYDLFAVLKSHQLSAFKQDSTLVVSLYDLMKSKAFYPSVQVVIDIIPVIYSREYSISSSPKISPDSLSFAFTIHEYKVGEEIRMGVASNYLNRKIQNFLKGSEEVIPLKIKSAESPFELPNPQQSTLMIAPGTSISAFVGILEHMDEKHGDVNIYHGCRRQKDFIYRKRVEHLHHKIKSDVATSQEGDKIYVQQLVKRNVGDIVKMLMNGGRVYICGGVLMCKEILEMIEMNVKLTCIDDGTKVWESILSNKQIQQERW